MAKATQKQKCTTLADLKTKNAFLEVVHPTFGAIGKVELSNKYRSSEAAKISAMANALKVSRLQTKYAKNEELSQEELVALIDTQIVENNNVVKQVVVGWDQTFADIAGEYSTEVLNSIVDDPDFDWLVAQVFEFYSDKKNFFTKPAV